MVMVAQLANLLKKKTLNYMISKMYIHKYIVKSKVYSRVFKLLPFTFFFFLKRICFIDF